MDGKPPPLENFFEFASKDLPNLPEQTSSASLSSLRETWSSTHGSSVNTSSWSYKPPTSGFDDEYDNKDYVNSYQKAMEDKIAKAVARQASMNMEDDDDTGDCRSDSRSTQVARSSSYDMTSLAGTLPGVGGLDDCDEIWHQYNIDTFRFRKDTGKLAVFKHKSQIMAAIESNQVVIVEGYTGCGKTTQIPQYILERYCEMQKRCNIVVTQPRRLAAVSVAQRVCDEKGWNLGSIVGYQVGLAKNTTPSTRLTYVTTGILLQSLISKKSLSEYSHIIVDEVHERDLETDLLLLVIKKILVERADMTTRIILMSATLNPRKFADYFPNWQANGIELKAAIVQIPSESTYPVKEYYLDTLNINSEVEGMFDEAKVHEPTYKLAVDYIISLDEEELADSANGSTADVHESLRGGVLIFLPGFLEIETMCNLLNDTMNARIRDRENPVNYKWLIYPLHSTITSEEQQKVFSKIPEGHRKIVVATNIAESSITVTDMRYVIDFCLTKSLGCDPITNYTCLRMEWASQDQCTQRRGRVGRVAPGCVFRMVPHEVWLQLNKETIPDMEKSSLENVVLKVKNLDMGSPQAILALAIDPPKLSLISRAVAHLKEVGALAITTNGNYTKFDGDLTPMGVIMSKLPLDVRFSRLIVLGHIFGVLEETIIIAAGLCGKSPFSDPFTKRLNAYTSKLSWSNDTFSDFFGILCLYRTWYFRWEGKSFGKTREERQWGRDYFVQLNMMREIKTLVDDISKRLETLDIQVDRQRLMSEGITAQRGLLLKIVIAGAFYPNYFIRQRPTQKDYEKNIVKDLCCFNPMYSMYFSGFPQEQPGQVYADAIAGYFKTGNSIPHVHFSGAKVIVEFDPRGDRLGRMSLSVYRGLRMRQIRQNVSFGIMSSHHSYELLQNELDQSKTLRYLLSPKQIELPKVTEGLVKAVVTHMENPDLYFVVYETKSSTIQSLTNELVKNSRHAVPLRTDDLFVGALCFLEFKSEFYRGRIDYVQSSKDVLVYLLDHGNSIWRKVHHLLQFNKVLIDKGVHTIEAQAIQCRIFGVKPLSKYASIWNEEATAIMSKICTGKAVHLQIYSVVESVVACNLSPTGAFEDDSVRQILLEGRLASVMDESADSRENNYLRFRLKKSTFKEEDIKMYNAKQAKKVLPPIPIPIRPPHEGRLVAETSLKGPFSPLEMEFTSLCNSAHMKQVMIDRTSVNKVALDQEPTSGTTRLLVAGTVSISHRSGAVSVRDTTILPAIPGLVGLLTMLFCPKLELRVDFPLARYTGCVSGLGVDPTTGRSVYGDHDLEIVFDTKFDDDDIKKINVIRQTMNMILSGEYNERTPNLREVIWNRLNELLERDREPLEEQWPNEPHQWGVIKPSFMVNTSNRQSNDGVVFPSHQLVRMTLRPGEAYRNTRDRDNPSVFSY